MTNLKSFIEDIESHSLKRAFLTLFAWIILRIFFESVFESSHYLGYIPFSYKALVIYFLHYPSFYLSLFLVIVMVTSLITRTEIKKTISVFAFGFGIVVFVPFIDWVIGGGFRITYPLRMGPYLFSSLNPFVSIMEYGGSPGQRIVFFLVCLLVAFYGYLKTKKIISGVALFIILYLLIILMGGMPTLLAGDRPEDVYRTGGILYSDTQKYTSIFILLLISFVVLYFYLIDKRSFRLLILSIRLERSTFYGAVGLAGFFLALQQSSYAPRVSFIFDWVGLVILYLAIFFGFTGTSVVNDFFDKNGDSITRLRNPLTRDIEPQYYLFWGIVLKIFTLTLSLLLGYVPFLIMITLLILGLLYSMPPVRLKRIPLVSSFTLAVSVVLVLAMGYSIIAGGEVFNRIPGSILKATLLSGTFGFTAKDINDIEGDRRTGIRTLPVIFSTSDGRLLRLPMGIIISSSYLFFPVFIKGVLPGSAVFAVSTLLYTILVKRLNEWFYFLLLYLYGGYLFIILSSLPQLI